MKTVNSMSSIERINEIYSDSEKNQVLPGALYLIATPIGNLADISVRAVKILASVDFIAAEDTRNTAKLLSVFDIKKPMISYYEHNKKEHGSQIIEKLKSGLSCALVTDAGTPAVSDPGEDIVRECIENGITVTSIPGACAAICALTLSGLPTKNFIFEGFLSANKKERCDKLKEAKDYKYTLIYYEAPHKLKTTLKDMLDIFGDRKITLARELTKLNEQLFRTTIEEANLFYSQNEPRGEYVLIVEGNTQNLTSRFWENMSVEEHVDYYVTNSNLSKTEAIKAAAKDRGLPKNEIYKHFF